MHTSSMLLLNVICIFLSRNGKNLENDGRLSKWREKITLGAKKLRLSRPRAEIKGGVAFKGESTSVVLILHSLLVV